MVGGEEARARGSEGEDEDEEKEKPSGVGVESGHSLELVTGDRGQRQLRAERG